MKIKIVTHYAKDDTEFCCDDWGGELLDEDGKEIYAFMDHYHNDVTPDAAFIAGIEFALGIEVEIECENIADGE